METGFELEPTREVTTRELDELVVSYKQAKQDYDLAHVISVGKYNFLEELKETLIALLTMAGKNSYTVDGVALVSVITKSQVTTPKTNEEKELFFGWLEWKYGRDAMIAYQSINHQSLNSLYNKELETALAKGEDFTVPGIGLPMIVRTLSVRNK